MAKDSRFIPATEFTRLEGDNAPVEAAVELINSLRKKVIEERESPRIAADLELEESGTFRDWCSDAPLLTFEEEQTLFRALNLLRFRVNRLRIRLSPSRPSKRAMDQIEQMLLLVEQIRSQLLCEVLNRDLETPVCEDPQGVVADLLERAGSVLDDREHEILLHRFGINRNNGLGRTLREVAEDLGLSKERVRQLQLKALEKLREILDPGQFFGDAAMSCH